MWRLSRRPPSIPFLLLAALGFLLPSAAPPSEELPPLNAKVVDFARSNLGKKVGNGICITLAVEALRDAGAKRFPLGRADGDYEWGAPVESLAEALPGDILQFRDAIFKGKKRLPRGRWISWNHVYAHHTAIVLAVSDGGRVITILHQNAGRADAEEAKRQVVQEGTLRMDSLQKGGWVRAYRPIPDDRDRDPSRNGRRRREA